LPVKKSKPRTATSRRRIKKYEETYRAKTVPLWFKKAMPEGASLLEDWLTNQDELEKQIFAQLDADGISGEQQVYYAAFARRLFSTCLRFWDQTYEKEKQSLKNEFILRGLNASELETIIGLCDSKCSIVRGVPPALADEKVKISVTDTTTDYLIAKLLAGTGISLTQLNPGGNEQLRIDALAHALLSTMHSDTLAAAVVRGDLIIGNSTPRWARLPIGVATRVLKSDGVDPSWSQVDHTELIGVTPDQHHARLHSLWSPLDHAGSITDAQHGIRTLLNAHAHGDLSGVTSNQHHAQLHKDTHKTGGGDAFVLADLLDAVARVKVRWNTGGVDVGARRRLNFINGAYISLTIADDPANEEVDVTVDGITDNPAEGRPSAVAVTSYVIPGVELVSVGTTGVVSDRVYYEPFYVVTTITLNLIGVEAVVAGSTFALTRLGIYNADRDWQPTTLVVDAGQVSCNTLGVKTLAINVTLPPGRYLFARNSQDTSPLCQFRMIRGGSRYTQLISTMGVAPLIVELYMGQLFGPFPSPGTPWQSVSLANAPFGHVVFCGVSVP